MKVRLRTEKVTSRNDSGLIVHEDLVNEMWSEYLNNVDDYDQKINRRLERRRGWCLCVREPSLRILVSVSITVT